MKFLIFILVNLFYIDVANATIKCKFFVDKSYRVEEGKFKKDKVTKFEKTYQIIINEIKATSKFNTKRLGSYVGIINGGGLMNREVSINERNRVIYINQLEDSTGNELFSHYTIFKNEKNKDGFFMAYMYMAYPNTTIKYGKIRTYKGFCDIEIGKFF